jgi:conjugative transposon TraJ protein
MRREILKTALGVVTGLLLPNFLHAQDLAGEIESFESVLETLYDEMLPLSGGLIDVGRGLAGFGALWYIASRVWRHIANAEPVDFYPLLRPFALGLIVLMFPSFLAVINSILKPTVAGTEAMVDGTNDAIVELMRRKEEAIMRTPAWQMYVGPDGSGDRDKWYQYTHPDGGEEGLLEGIDNGVQFYISKMAYNFRHSIKQTLSEILHVLFEAAALCINTIRTFYLIVLAILGPIVLGFSVFDGLHHSLQVWIARYINVFLWLPVANIFGAIIGKIQENMLRIDINQVNTYGDTFFSSTDTAYLIFMVIGVVGYFTVPSVASYIIHSSGANALLHKATNLGTSAAHNSMASINSFLPKPGDSRYDDRPRGDRNDDGRNSNEINDTYTKNKLSGK